MAQELDSRPLVNMMPHLRKWADAQSFQQRLSKKQPFNLYAGAGLVTLVILTAAFAPLLARLEPDTIFRGSQLTAPGGQFWFGTDALGRDLFSRVLFGARYALGMSVGAMLVSAVPGVLLGVVSGYRGGWLDNLISRLIEVWLSLPGLLLALLLIARLGPSMTTTALALGLSGIPGFFRVVRAETRSLAKSPFIEAAESIGARKRRVIFYHLLPNLTSTIIVLCSMRVGTFLLAGSGLSFIGLGAQPPQPEWGTLLAAGKDYFQQAWWLGFFPGLAILCTVLGFNLLGDGLRDIFSRQSIE